MRKPAVYFAALAAALLVASEAHAHKIKVFATADGATITGYVYFSGGGRAKNTTLEVTGPNGESLGATTTNDNGEFTFTASTAIDHLFRAATGDGHIGEYTVTAAELSGLPGGDASETPQPPATADLAPPAASPSPDASTGTTVTPPMASDVAALRAQIVAMREQLDAYQERRNMQDIIGGVGYILGLAGLAFYLLSKRALAEKHGND